MPPTNHRAEVEAYVDGVIDGTITAGRYVVMACQRYRRDMAKAKRKPKKKPGRQADKGKKKRNPNAPPPRRLAWYFDEGIANRTIDFIQQLEHTEDQWAGEKFLLSSNQKFIIWNLFGFRWLADGMRRFKVSYLTVGRGYGKTALSAAICIVLMFYDVPLTVRSEGYAVATMKDQAARICNATYRMIERNPLLKKMSRAYKYRENIISIVLEDAPYLGSVLKAIGSDGRTADALNPAFIIKDELHEWRERHRTLKEKLETGGGKRAQFFDMTLTTAGDDQSIIWIQFDDYCCAVLESESRGKCNDESCFAFIARLDEPRPCDCGGSKPRCKKCNGTGTIPGDDIFDEDVWIKANPNIGDTPTWEFMREEANKAKNDPAEKHSFIRYRANSKVRSSRKVINPDLWARCAGSLTDPWPKNSFGAWDLGWRDDLASIAACCEIGGVWEIKQLSFCPEDGRRDLTREPWATWINEGLLIPTPGNTTDIAYIREKICQWRDAGVSTWVFDPNNARQLGTELLNEYHVTTEEFVQSYGNYNEPIRELLMQLARGKIRHSGDSLLAWAAGNLVVKENSASMWMPDKIKSTEKIDPVVAVLMAYARSLWKEQKPRSVYETRGVIGG